MSSLADLFPPGTDLCSMPAGSPPYGDTTNFSDTGLRPLTLVISVISTTIATIIGAGRLYVNIKKPSLSDAFVFLAILLNIGSAVVMIIYAKYFRHQWNFPLCWFDGEFEKVSYVWQMTGVLSLFFGKTATLMLYQSLFGMKQSTRIAIWIGIWVCFAIYGSSLGTLSYFAAPAPGETWDDLMVKVLGTTFFPLYWAVSQGAAGTVLDIYIFILPLPVIYRLHLSHKRRIQLMALFFIGFLGVFASVISLVYRAKSIIGISPDKTYNAGVLVICNLVEMNVALIVCSTPPCAGSIRIHFMQSRIFRSLRSKLGYRGHSSSLDGAGRVVPKPDKLPLEHSYPLKPEPAIKSQTSYGEIPDAWLLDNGVTVDIEASRDHFGDSKNPTQNGLRVLGLLISNMR